MTGVKNKKAKKPGKKKYIYNTLKIVIGFLILFELFNIFSDVYNFHQFNKAKVVLDSIPDDSKKFYHLDDFNSIYNTDIKPIRNCYYISNSNGSEKYIFSFKNYSILYRLIYKDLFIYPKYDLSSQLFCEGVRGCYNKNIENFHGIIHNRCDNYDHKKIFN